MNTATRRHGDTTELHHYLYSTTFTGPHPLPISSFSSSHARPLYCIASWQLKMSAGIERTAGKPLHTDMKIEDSDMVTSTPRTSPPMLVHFTAS